MRSLQSAFRTELATTPVQWLRAQRLERAHALLASGAPGLSVTDVAYRPGRWLAAYKFESATENERSDITVEREVRGRTRTVVFRQIVGLVARRVVTRVRKGDRIATGERIGLMKFGSRMDVFVPPEVELAVRTGDRTVAGQTVLGRWPASTQEHVDG